MEKKSWYQGCFPSLVTLVILILVVVAYSVYMAHLEPEDQNTIIVSYSKWTPGGQGYLHLRVEKARKGTPLANAQVNMSLISLKKGSEKLSLADGKTNEKGDFLANFTLPKIQTGKYKILIETQSSWGKDKTSLNISVEDEVEIYTQTDKTLYQPGQKIQLMALAVYQGSNRPLNQLPLKFEIFDPRGNKVFRKELVTTDFGTAATDFELASEVNQGRYKIRVASGKDTVETTVMVKEYDLPPFEVQSTFSQSFYQVGQKATGQIRAHYFFDQPVEEAEVLVQIFSPRSQKRLAWKKVYTDKRGKASFEIPLPKKLFSYFERRENTLRAPVKITLRDEANQIHTVHRELVLAQKALEIYAIPANGHLVRGVENKVFLATTYPDGSPAQTVLEVKGKRLRTTSLGVTEISLVANKNYENFEVIARDQQGRVRKKWINLKVGVEKGLYLALDRVQYKVGEEIKFSLSTEAEEGNFFYDLTRRGQTLAAGQMEEVEGQWEGKFDLKENWAGTLTLRVYRLARSKMYQTRRTLVVRPQKKLNITANFHRKSYGPGKRALLKVHVTDQKGNPLTAALNLSAVDKSLYALQQKRPGLRAVYFTLAGELRKSRYPLRTRPGQEILEMDQPSQPQLPRKRESSLATNPGRQTSLTSPHQEFEKDFPLPLNFSELAGLTHLSSEKRKLHNQAAQAILALAEASNGQVLLHETYPDKLAAIREAQNRYFFVLNTILALVPLVLLITLSCYSFYCLYRKIKKEPEIYYFSPVTIGVKEDSPSKKAAEKETPSKSGENGDDSPQKAFQWLHQTHLTFSRLFVFPLLAPLPLFLFEARRLPQKSIYFLSVVFFISLLTVWLTFLFTFEKQKRFQLSTVGLTAFGAALAAGIFYYFLPHEFWRQEDYTIGFVFYLTGVGAFLTYVRQMGAGLPFLSQSESLSGSKQAVALSLLLPLLVISVPVVTVFLPQSSGEQHFNEDLFRTLCLSTAVLLFLAIPTVILYLKSYLERLQESRVLFHYIPSLVLVLLTSTLIFLPAIQGGRGRPAQDGHSLTQGGRTVMDTHVIPLTQEESSPRIRRHFPETLYWNPHIILKNGQGEIEIPVADSMTSYQVTGQAIDKRGRMGSFEKELKVFQPFFMDFDFPRRLTVGDEVSLPLRLYNYLPKRQEIRIQIEKEKWFELKDPPLRTVPIGPGKMRVVYFHLQVKDFGRHRLQVKAIGSEASDGLEKTVEIRPPGVRETGELNGFLTGETKEKISFPKEATAGAYKIYIKAYPGLASVALEGAEGLLQLPTGCFEQTSSKSYPNALVLQYLKGREGTSNKILKETKNLVQKGYQRILTFERPGGGFDWWGKGPALVWLTAYGLQQLAATDRVIDMDREVMDRANTFLLGRQNSKGYWEPRGKYRGNTAAHLSHPRLALTAYVCWSLAEAGYRGNHLERGRAYLLSNWEKARESNYHLALIANALLPAHRDSPQVIKILNLLDQRASQKGRQSWWKVKGPTASGAIDSSARLETTALATLAFLKGRHRLPLVERTLHHIISQRNSQGTWGTTQATILALKALVYSQNFQSGKDDKEEGKVHIYLNGKKEKTWIFSEKNRDVIRQISLSHPEVTRESEIRLATEGNVNCLYQLSWQFYQPLSSSDKKEENLNFHHSYDRERLLVGQRLTGRLKIGYKKTSSNYMTVVELPLPAGFVPEKKSFEVMVKKELIEKYEIKTHSIILYLGEIPKGDQLSLIYHLQSRYPVKIQVPPATAYPYYTPDHRMRSQSARLVVEGR